MDARLKVFREKIKKLGYSKTAAKEINKIMEKIGDFGMMSDAGNKKIARAVQQSKNEKDLRAKLEKISTMAGGKYSEASEDEVMQNALNALEMKGASGTQSWADKNILVQLGNFRDLTKDGEVSPDDNKKSKGKADYAAKVYKKLMKVKRALTTKYI